MIGLVGLRETTSAPPSPPASQFIATMLDISRERIASLKVHDQVGIGYHYTLDPWLIPEQLQEVKDELVALKDRIVHMNSENARARQVAPLVDCGVTLLLTPISEDAAAGDVEATSDLGGDTA